MRRLMFFVGLPMILVCFGISTKKVYLSIFATFIVCFCLVDVGSESTDLDPYELFVSLGMLIVESRLPTTSVKGRRDGPHCPPALGVPWSTHICDQTLPEVLYLLSRGLS